MEDDNSHIKIVYGSSYCAGLVREVVEGIKNGAKTYLAGGGIGGTYWFGNCRGDYVAVVKPTDEEPGAPNNPKGCIGLGMGQPGVCPYIRVGESAYRGVAAYLLDHDHFAKVPFTALVEISHWTFNINDDLHEMRRWNRKAVTKTASLQQFIPPDSVVQSYRRYAEYLEACVHRIGILDIRICNVNRHEGNIMVRRLNGGQAELIPISHGLCLPEAFPLTTFAWSRWSQASTPFTEDEREYIRKLDPFADADMLRKELPMIPEASLRILVVCTIFLKEAASFGFCLSEIGDMMDRYFVRFGGPFSELELVCLDVKRSLPEIPSSSQNTSVGFADMDEDAWSLFLERFRAALRPAFYNHVAISFEKLGMF